MEQEMRYTYSVYECGSFSKAANALYMPQPALSIAVQRVESRMGMPLFRGLSTYPITLTNYRICVTSRLTTALVYDITFS